MKIIWFAVGLIMAATPALAQELRITNKGGGFACLTESAHDELMKAIRSKDFSWAASMIDSGLCVSMKDGLRATL